MHLHVPKPLHTWREFIGKVGIIVLGLLSALCAEQLIEQNCRLTPAPGAPCAHMGKVPYFDCLAWRSRYTRLLAP